MYTGGAVYLSQFSGFPKDAFSKSVVAHEFGHFIQDLLMGYPKDDPMVGSSVTLCNCSHIPGTTVADHCLQSRHEHTRARLEGWANFYVANLYNNPSHNNAWYGHYGRVRFPPASSAPVSPPVPWNVLTPALWMETHCSSSMTDRGVEADWMGFFYAVHNKSTTKYTFANIKSVFQEACPGSGLCDGNDDVKWANLENAAAVFFPGGKGAYWEIAGNNYGVNH